MVRDYTFVTIRNYMLLMARGPARVFYSGIGKGLETGVVARVVDSECGADCRWYCVASVARIING